MKKLVKKILVSSFVGASMFLFSNVAFAQNYVLNVAFVGDSLVNNVKNIFFNSNTSKTDGSYIWGIHQSVGDDVFFYRFKDINLDINNINEEIISDCDIVFIVVDFSKPEEIRRRIDDYIGKVRTNIINKNVKMMLIGKNIRDEQRWLNFLNNLKIINNIDGNIIEKEDFDFLVIKEGSDIRESFFEIEKKLGDLDRFKLKDTNDLPIDVKLFLRDLKHEKQINDLAIIAQGLSDKVNEHDEEICKINNELTSIKEEFREELSQLGNDSWKILEKVVSIFSRDGHMEPKGCQEVINEINDISRQYGEFRNAFIDLKTYVNNIVRTHTGEINCFKNDVRREIQEYGESMANFTNETTRRVDGLSQKLDDDENNLQERINRTNISLDETRVRLDQRSREFNTCISNLHSRIDTVDGGTSDRLNEMARTLEGYGPVLEGVAELQSSYEEFRNDFDRKMFYLDRETKKAILEAFKKGRGNTCGFTRFWGKSEQAGAIDYLTERLEKDLEEHTKKEEEKKKEKEKEKEKDKDKE